MRPEAELLKQVSLFQFLDDNERKELAAQLDVVTVAAGQEIFHYGDPGASLYVINSGEVEVFMKNPHGRTHRAGIFHTRRFLWRTVAARQRVSYGFGHGDVGYRNLAAGARRS